MACAGDSTTICGGPSRLSSYQYVASSKRKRGVKNRMKVEEEDA